MSAMRISDSPTRVRATESACPGHLQVIAMNASGPICLCAALLALAGCATAPPGVGGASSADDELAFLSDYSKLRPVEGHPFDEIYVAPDAAARAERYNAVMVDQPRSSCIPSRPTGASSRTT
jgi:hypothetical protein